MVDIVVDAAAEDQDVVDHVEEAMVAAVEWAEDHAVVEVAAEEEASAEVVVAAAWAVEEEEALLATETELPR